MARCDRCGNQYDKAFEVRFPDGSSYTFDCFECAINEVAPTCAHCDNRIIGHGMEAADGTFFCCAHCARQAGVEELEDRTDEEARLPAGTAG